MTHRYVTATAKDHQGFIWIGTSDGLNRFDGRHYIHFKRSFEAPFHISGRSVRNLRVDTRLQLIVQYGGLSKIFDCIDPATFNVRPIAMDSLIEEQEFILDIEQDGSGDIFVMTTTQERSRLFKLEGDNELTLVYSVSHPGTKGQHFIIDGRSHWLALENGIVMGLNSGGVIERNFEINSIQPSAREGDVIIEFVSERPDGSYWMAVERAPGLYIIDKDASTPVLHRDFGYTDALFRWITSDKKGNEIMYAGSSFGSPSKILLLDGSTDLMTDVSDQHKTQNEATCAIGDDFKKGFYLGTVDKWHQISLNQSFFKVDLAQQVAPGQWGTSIRGLTVDSRGRLIVARELDDWFLFGPNGEIDTLLISDRYDDYTDHVRCTRELVQLDGRIYGAMHAPDETYHLTIFNPNTSTKKTIELDHHIQTIYEVEGKLFLGCGDRGNNGALYLFDPLTEKLELIKNEQGKNPLQERHMQSILKVDDELWLGGFGGGMYVLDLKDNTFKTASKHASLFPSTERVVTEMLRHSDGRVFIGYYGYGFDVLDLEKNEKKNYTVVDGLSNENIASMVEDDQSDVWVATFDGLCRFDNETNLFLNFYEEDGISHNEFNRFSSYKDPSGKLYFGGLNGVISFYPEEIEIPESDHQLMLRYVEYFDKQGKSKRYIGGFDQAPDIVIPAGYRSLKMGFILNNFLNQKGNNYEYQLNDTIATGWTNVGNLGELSLNFLPAGKQRLFVRGKNRDGQYAANTLQLKMDVKEFFYQSEWFWISLFILGIGFVATFLTYRFRQQLKLIEMRQEISRDLHDEVGSLLTGMAMKTDLLGMRVEEKMKPEISKISRMGREAVRQMRDIVWSIDNKKNTVGDLVDRIHEFASESIHNTSFQYDLEVQNCDSSMVIPQEVRKNIYLIVREAVNNTIKHSNGNLIQIRLARFNESCTVRIMDNGKVNGSFKNKTGLGMQNMHDRAKNMNGHMVVDTEAGFDVQLKFPMN